MNTETLQIDELVEIKNAATSYLENAKFHLFHGGFDRALQFIHMACDEVEYISPLFARKEIDMPKYKYVNVTCYCGAQYPYSRVGEKIKCSCGVTLHTLQKKGGGRVWGDAKNREHLKKMIALVQSGGSKLDAQFIDAG